MITLGELRRELNKLPLEADNWPVQILYWDAAAGIYRNEDISDVSADDYVVIMVGDSVKMEG